MNIYEIDSQILSCIDEETGEILDVKRLEKLIQDKNNKIESVACWYKNTVAEAEAIRNEISNLKARKERDEKLAENLKRYISDVLDGEKFRTPKVSVSYRKSSSVEVDDVYRLPDEFLTYKAPEPKKSLLKSAIDSGQKFEGVRIIEKMNIQIK